MNCYFKLESSCYVDYGLCKIPKLGDNCVMTGQTIDADKLPNLIFEHNFPVGEPIPDLLTGRAVLASHR